MPPISAVAMDLSGVLIEDIQQHNLRIVAEQHGLPLPELQREFHQLFGAVLSRSLTEPELWPELAHRVGAPDAGLLRTTFLASFRFREGAPEFLARLKSKVRFFVWTNMPAAWVDAMDRTLALEDVRFVNGHQIHWPKPDPGFFQYALDIHGVAPDDLFYVTAHRDSHRAAEPYTAGCMLFPKVGFDPVRWRIEQLLAERTPTAAPASQPRPEPAPDVYIENPRLPELPVANGG